MRRAEAGISLFESTVVLALVAIFALALALHVRRLQAEAERAGMLHVLASIRSAVALETARAYATDRRPELAALIGSNPMDRLAKPPPNYRGAFSAPDPARIEAGSWYFDTSRRELVYRVRHASYFSTPLAGSPRARFKFTAVHSDREGSPEGLKVVAVEPWRWIEPGRSHATATKE